MTKEDFGSDDPMAGVEFQDRLERKAFEMGVVSSMHLHNVCQTFSAYRTDLPNSIHTWNVTIFGTCFHARLPKASGRRFLFFDRKIAGFAGDQGVLIAPETRTTAPIRFLRDEQMEAVGLPGMMLIATQLRRWY